MSPELNKILKALAKELTLEVTKQVTEKLRETYVADIIEACNYSSRKFMPEFLKDKKAA